MATEVGEWLRKGTSEGIKKHLESYRSGYNIFEVKYREPTGLTLSS